MTNAELYPEIERRTGVSVGLMKWRFDHLISCANRLYIESCDSLKREYVEENAVNAIVNFVVFRIFDYVWDDGNMPDEIYSARQLALDNWIEATSMTEVTA